MKRLLMVLTLAALFVVGMIVMAFPAAADTENLCRNHPNHPQCVTENPGGVEDSPSCEPGRNPNCETHRELPNH